jgi:AcrR family transcriptional regulator
MGVKALDRAAIPERAELSPARRRLFETALVLFSRDGYNGVSVRDIVKELDQHPTAIYAHVSSKQELLFELVKMGHEELRDRIRLAVLEAEGHPVAQLRAIVYANTLTHLTVPDLARICLSEYGCLSPEQMAVIDVLRVDMGSLLRDVINRGVTQTVFEPLDQAITVAAIAAISARVVDWWPPELGVDPAHIAATHADLAVRMLTR